MISLLGTMALAIAAVTLASVVVHPNRARSFDLIHGSMFLADLRAPVAVDLATGRPTVRLLGAGSEVSARSANDLDLLHLSDSTLLMNRRTGEFNMVDGTGFVVKTTAGGVPLPADGAANGVTAIASGPDAYLVRSGGPRTSVFLIGKATVQAAANGTKKITPRASTVLAEPSTDAAGTAASADGALWLLTGAGSERTVRRLMVPADSQTGARLISTGYGTVTGPAALESAIGAAGRPAANLVGIATSGSLRVLAGAGARTLPLIGLHGVSRILPAGNAAGRLSFLIRDAAGWHLASAGPTGAAELRALTAIPTAADLAVPAMSDGRLFTLDRGRSGTLWQIDGNGDAAALAKRPSYPTAHAATGQAQEVADFSDTEVLAEGSRVLYNSPGHVLALAVFTDGSREPAEIDKSSAVELNASGGAAALTDAHNAKKGASPNHPGKQPRPITPNTPTVNNRARCAATSQLPHVPTITSAAPGSRSVLLSWAYPLLDNQDCVPSTYTVAIATLTDGSPAAPGRVVVQGQTGVNVTGLYPRTQYQITVTAYINGRGTTSPSVLVVTGREGPAAPANVTTTVDTSGDWTVSWKACGAVSSGCVPATDWRVIPTFCDGLGVTSAATPLDVPGDPSLTAFSATFRGGSALLGRGLTFQVQGVSAQGDVGGATNDRGCSYTWAPPQADQMHLTASTPQQTDFGSTTTASVTLDLGRTPIVAQGGVGAQFSFRLLSGSSVVATQGPATTPAATFPGIAAGRSYQVQAVVAPPRHPEAAVTLGPVPIQTRAGWPNISVTSAKVSADNGDPRHGTLTVTLAGLASKDAAGERFTLTDRSAFSCGNTSAPLDNGHQSIDPSRDAITLSGIDLAQYYGTDCSVTVQLVEDPSTATTPPMFGGVASQVLTHPVDMPGLPSGAGVNNGNFSAVWTDQGSHSAVQVSIAKSDPSMLFSSGWSETVYYEPAQAPCGSDTQNLQLGSSTIVVPQPCVDAAGGDPSRWRVKVSYWLVGRSDPVSYVLTPSGAPPSYTPPPSPTPTAPSSPPSSPPPPSPSPSPSPA